MVAGSGQDQQTVGGLSEEARRGGQDEKGELKQDLRVFLASIFLEYPELHARSISR